MLRDFLISGSNKGGEYAETNNNHMHTKNNAIINIYPILIQWNLCHFWYYA